MLVTLHKNHSVNRKELGHKNIKISYNPKSKYVPIPDNHLCTHCDNKGHFKDSCKVTFKQPKIMSSILRNKNIINLVLHEKVQDFQIGLKKYDLSFY